MIYDTREGFSDMHKKSKMQTKSQKRLKIYQKWLIQQVIQKV